MTIQPGKKHLTVYQGASFQEQFTWEDENGPIDLTGYTARMQARENYILSAPVFLDLTTENGGIALGEAAGTITLFIGAQDTAGITAGDGFYDLELQSASGIVYRLLQGNMYVSNEVTL